MNNQISVSESIKEGLEQQNKGNYSKAIFLFQEAIDNDPMFADAYFYKGNALFQIQEYQQVVKCLQVCIQLSPNTISYREEQSDQEIDMTQSQTIKFDKYKKQNSQAYSLLASICILLGVFKIYQTLSLITQETNLKIFFRSLVFLQKRKEAIDNLQKCIQQGDTSIEDFQLKCLLHFQEGTFVEAIRLLDLGLSHYEKNQNLLLFKGECLMQLKQYNQALDIFDQCSDKDNLLISTNRALCQFSLHEIDDSDQILDNALMLNGNVHFDQYEKLIIWNKGMMLFSRNLFQEAQFYFDHAIELIESDDQFSNEAIKNPEDLIQNHLHKRAQIKLTILKIKMLKCDAKLKAIPTLYKQLSVLQQIDDDSQKLIEKQMYLLQNEQITQQKKRSENSKDSEMLDASKSYIISQTLDDQSPEHINDFKYLIHFSKQMIKNIIHRIFKKFNMIQIGFKLKLKIQSIILKIFYYNFYIYKIRFILFNSQEFFRPIKQISKDDFLWARGVSQLHQNLEDLATISFELIQKKDLFLFKCLFALYLNNGKQNYAMILLECLMKDYPNDNELISIKESALQMLLNQDIDLVNESIRNHQNLQRRESVKNNKLEIYNSVPKQLIYNPQKFNKQVKFSDDIIKNQICHKNSDLIDNNGIIDQEDQKKFAINYLNRLYEKAILEIQTYQKNEPSFKRTKNIHEIINDDIFDDNSGSKLSIIEQDQFSISESNDDNLNDIIPINNQNDNQKKINDYKDDNNQYKQNKIDDQNNYQQSSKDQFKNKGNQQIDYKNEISNDLLKNLKNEFNVYNNDLQSSNGKHQNNQKQIDDQSNQSSNDKFQEIQYKNDDQFYDKQISNDQFANHNKSIIDQNNELQSSDKDLQNLQINIHHKSYDIESSNDQLGNMIQKIDEQKSSDEELKEFQQQIDDQTNGLQLSDDQLSKDFQKQVFKDINVTKSIVLNNNNDYMVKVQQHSNKKTLKEQENQKKEFQNIFHRIENPDVSLDPSFRVSVQDDFLEVILKYEIDEISNAFKHLKQFEPALYSYANTFYFFIKNYFLTLIPEMQQFFQIQNLMKTSKTTQFQLQKQDIIDVQPSLNKIIDLVLKIKKKTSIKNKKQVISDIIHNIERNPKDLRIVLARVSLCLCKLYNKEIKFKLYEQNTDLAKETFFLDQTIEKLWEQEHVNYSNVLIKNYKDPSLLAFKHVSLIISYLIYNSKYICTQNQSNKLELTRLITDVMQCKQIESHFLKSKDTKCTIF